jgi:Amt family ammonium transporter
MNILSRLSTTALPDKAKSLASLGIGALAVVLPQLVFGQDAPDAVATVATAATPLAPMLNTGDTAWMLTSSVLVLMMTIPGLSLFYAGMVRTKNVLSVFMQCFAITALVTVIWTVYGYSMAFDTTGMEKGVINLNSFIGSMSKAFLQGVNGSLNLTIPESVFAMFQLTFAIITPALIIGAFAERVKFSAMLVFMAVWVTVCYIPIAHMVWGGPGSLLGDLGVLDFAGGTVVHINAGIAGFVCCLMIGKRKGYLTTAMPPHNLTYTIMGAGLLWVGWFGFNAGSAVASGDLAGRAMIGTQIATATAALAWMIAEWLSHGKPSVLGIASGAVAGLVAITPASGTAGPEGALLIGLAAGVICFLAATVLKRKMGYDDSLDVFGVHAVGGIVGAILTGLCADSSLGGVGLSEGVSISNQLVIQCEGVLFTIIYTGILSAIIFKLVDATIGMRVSEEDESLGLDLSSHNERGYVTQS